MINLSNQSLTKYKINSSHRLIFAISVWRVVMVIHGDRANLMLLIKRLNTGLQYINVYARRKFPLQIWNNFTACMLTTHF